MELVQSHKMSSHSLLTLTDANLIAGTKDGMVNNSKCFLV